jgi:hypothetical protein
MRHLGKDRRVSALAVLADQLSRASERALAVQEPIAWPERLADGAVCFSDELLSLGGHPLLEELDEATRRRLGFWEAVNFFSINIHGERILIDGLQARHAGEDFARVRDYLGHFLTEERQHTEVFREFCQRFAGKIYPDRQVAFPREYADGEADLLFFARVVVFEEIVDVYNVTMMRDARLVAVAREINARHHEDEARHLAFGRALLAELAAQRLPTWSDAVRTRVQRELQSWIEVTFSSLHNPAVYSDAGLPSPLTLRAHFHSPAARERRARLSRALRERLSAAQLIPAEAA